MCALRSEFVRDGLRSFRKAFTLFPMAASAASVCDCKALQSRRSQTFLYVRPSLTDSRLVWLTFSETSIFTRQITELLSDNELNALQWALMAKPEWGDLIRGSGGLRKIR